VIAPLRETLAPFADAGKKKAGETDEQYAQRLAAARQIKQFPETIKAAAAALVAQARAITLALDVDRKEERVGLSLTLNPRAGSRLESGLRFLGGGRSRFGALLDAADGGLLVHIPPVADGKQSLPDAEAFAASAGNALPLNGALREAATKLLTVLLSTMAADGIDAAVLLSVRLKDEVAVVAGLKLQGGKKVDQALRDLYKSLPAEEKKDLAVDWNHDKHGAARIHRARAADDPDELFLAIRDDVAFLGYGKQSLDPLKAALDAFGKGAPAASPIVRARLTAKALLGDADARKAAEKLSAEERQKLFVELTLDGGKELQLRLRMSTHVLRLMAAFAESDK
jgi:hypothetical protein